MKNKYSLFDKTDFGKIYKKMTANTGLITSLVQMQTDVGVNEHKAYETADYLIHRVALFEGCESLLCEDAEDVLDNFLTHSEKLQGYDRKLLLHQLYFGLHLYQDTDLMEQLREGATVDELFRDYYAVYGEDPGHCESFLERYIRREAGAFRVSPEVMKAMVKKLEKSDNLVAASAAMSEEGNCFKCIVAMNLYLNNQDTMSIDDAVSTACTDIEVEAVADAVARGQMAADAAHKILTALCIATILVALITLVGGIFAPQAMSLIISNADWLAMNAQAAAWEGMANMQLAEMAVTTGGSVLKSGLMGLSFNLFLCCGAASIAEDDIARFVGNLASRFHFYYSKNTHSAANDMETLAEIFAQTYAAENVARDAAEWAPEEELEEEEFQEDAVVLF